MFAAPSEWLIFCFLTEEAVFVKKNLLSEYSE